MTDAAIRAAERSGDTYALAVALIRAGRAAEALRARGWGYQVGDVVRRTAKFVEAFRHDDESERLPGSDGGLGAVTKNHQGAFLNIDWPESKDWFTDASTLELVEPAPP